MSLGYLSQHKKKEPSAENKLVLKEALLKAMADHKEVPTTSKVSISSTLPPPTGEARKEIPEEVLRKVLE